jgi:hypothetical protein
MASCLCIIRVSVQLSAAACSGVSSGLDRVDALPQGCVTSLVE